LVTKKLVGMLVRWPVLYRTLADESRMSQLRSYLKAARNCTEAGLPGSGSGVHSPLKTVSVGRL